MIVLLNKVCLRYLPEWHVILRFTEVNDVIFTTQSIVTKTFKFIWQDLFSIPPCGLAFKILHCTLILVDISYVILPLAETGCQIRLIFPSFSKYWLILVSWQCSWNKAPLSRRDKADKDISWQQEIKINFTIYTILATPLPSKHCSKPEGVEDPSWESECPVCSHAHTCEYA